MSDESGPEPTLDLARLREWIGREHVAEDVLDAQRARALELTLDEPATLEDDARLPPLWHWLWFNDVAPTGELAEDGHPRRGDFLPPVALPRRMWAGGRVRWPGDLIVGERAVRRSRVLDVTRKRGSSGELCFVTVEHRIEQGGETRLIEEHDIVYREAARGDGESGERAGSGEMAVADESDASSDHRTTGAGASKASRSSAAHAVEPMDACSPVIARESASRWRITPSVALLFRYSALTFNTHRIHYDREYCRDVEGYPDLVVHGPLTATLLARLAESAAEGTLATFDYRGRAPLFDGAAFTVEAEGPSVVGGREWTVEAGYDGEVATGAFVRLR